MKPEQVFFRKKYNTKQTDHHLSNILDSDHMDQVDCRAPGEVHGWLAEMLGRETPPSSDRHSFSGFLKQVFLGGVLDSQ